MVRCVIAVIELGDYIHIGVDHVLGDKDRIDPKVFDYRSSNLWAVLPHRWVVAVGSTMPHLDMALRAEG